MKVQHWVWAWVLTALSCAVGASAQASVLERVYETDMAEGLKAMALEGHGVAFLPHSAVKKELRSRRLVSAAPPDAEGLQMTMDVRAYREKPNGKDAPKGTAQALWTYLQAQAASCY